MEALTKELREPHKSADSPSIGFQICGSFMTLGNTSGLRWRAPQIFRSPGFQTWGEMAMLIILEIPGGKIFKRCNFPSQSISRLSLFIISVITDPQFSISRDGMSFIQSHARFSYIAFIFPGEITSVELNCIYGWCFSSPIETSRCKSWEIYHLNWCKRQISEAKLSITPFQNPQKFHTLPLPRFGLFFIFFVDA